MFPVFSCLEINKDAPFHPKKIPPAPFSLSCFLNFLCNFDVLSLRHSVARGQLLCIYPGRIFASSESTLPPGDQLFTNEYENVHMDLLSGDFKGWDIWILRCGILHQGFLFMEKRSRPIHTYINNYKYRLYIYNAALTYFNDSWRSDE